jgi:crotonobetainyl-CoA:carnitine CoA-transferase CaiB-like acyl-CoA transferase
MPPISTPSQAGKIEQTLEKAFAQAPASVWIERLHKVGIAAHAKVTVAELMVDASVRARGLSIMQHVEGAGEATMPGLSVHLSRTPMRLGDRCHQPGSDAPAILAALGLADTQTTLEQSWVLRTRDLPPAWS